MLSVARACSFCRSRHRLGQVRIPPRVEMDPRLKPPKPLAEPSGMIPRLPLRAVPNDASESGKVLLVEDDEPVRRALQRRLLAWGFQVDIAGDGLAAELRVRENAYDCIVSDISMPGMDGVQLLRAIRGHDLDVPVVLMTGAPSIDTAIEALRYGAMQYLRKPLELDELKEVVHRAVKLSALARTLRDVLALHGRGSLARDRAGLDSSLDRALAGMWMAYQPIVSAHDRQVCAFEALMRSDEPALPNPGAVLSAAERLNRLTDVGRRVRALAPVPMAERSELLFLNLHTRDLCDDELFDPRSFLASMANRVVLEVTERAPLDDMRDVHERLAALRKLGFKIAIDDLGAGYAGLNSFATLEPDFVKIDMSLVRDLDGCSMRRSIVTSITKLCHDLGIRVVAEGIETAAECKVLLEIGVCMLQGYFFARPERVLALAA